MKLSLFFLVVAVTIWVVLLRPVAILKGTGTVIKKNFKPASTYTQYQAGDRQNFRTPTNIPIAEGYILDLQFDGSSQTAVVGINKSEADNYQIGDRVDFEYSVRSFWPFCSRVYIHKITKTIK